MTDQEKADREFVEKLRSLSFRAQPAPSKVTTHRTDTAWVTETERTDKSGDHKDVNVRPTAVTIAGRPRIQEH